MSRARVLLLITAVTLVACEPAATPAGGSDFAVLAKAAEGYVQARPGRVLDFPRDHGAHPDFRIEWWYLTANLQGADGRDYGAQWTLFRSAVRPPGSLAAANPWQSEQVYMAHFALTWPDGHRAFQRYARGGLHGDEARAAVLELTHGRAHGRRQSRPVSQLLQHIAIQTSGGQATGRIGLVDRVTR